MQERDRLTKLAKETFGPDVEVKDESRFAEFVRQESLRAENLQLQSRLQELGAPAPPLPPDATLDEQNFYLQRFVSEADPQLREEARGRFTRILTEPVAGPAGAAFSQFLAGTAAPIPGTPSVAFQERQRERVAPIGPESFKQALAEQRAAPPPDIQPIGGPERRALEQTRQDFPQLPIGPHQRIWGRGEPVDGWTHIGLAELGEAALDPYNAPFVAAPLGRAAGAVGETAARRLPAVGRAVTAEARTGIRRLAGEVVPEVAERAAAQRGGVAAPEGFEWAGRELRAVGQPPLPVAVPPAQQELWRTGTFMTRPQRVQVGANAIDLQPIVPGLTRTQRWSNVARDMLEKAHIRTVRDEPRATAAMAERARINSRIESISNELGTRSRAVIEGTKREPVFVLDEAERIPSLAGIDPAVPGAPTIQDVAARLPVYEAHLTNAQRFALRELERDVGQFRPLMKSSGIEVPTRPDIHPDGGFYLPRGGADPAGLTHDMPMGLRGGRGIGKRGFERASRFNSMAEGVEAGYEYGAFDDAIAGYAKGAGQRTNNQNVANYFKELTDEAGELIGTTPKTRMLRQNPELVQRMDVLKREVQRMEQLGGSLSERQYKAVQRFMNDPAFTEIDQLAVALHQPVKMLTPRGVPRFARGLGAQKLARQVKGLEKKVTRGYQVGATRREIQSIQKGLQRQIQELTPEWKTAMRRAQAMERETGIIRLGEPGPLQGWAFPDEIADAANAVLLSEGPLVGGKRAVMSMVNAFNNLYRGVRATLDNSFAGIQGLLGLASDQKAYAGALKLSFRAWGRGGDKILGQFIVDFNQKAQTAGRLAANQWARAGLRVGGVETEFMLRGVVAKVPGVRQANRAFGFMGDALRLQWADDMLAGELKKGRTLQQVIDSGDLQRISRVTNNMTGWAEGRTFGDWGDLALFAPRYLQSRLETVTKAALSAGPNATIEQKAARGAILRLIGYGVMITEGANFALGNETDRRPIVNGRWNPNFYRIRAADRDWTVFGTWDSLARFMMLTAMGKPLDAWRSMASGTVSVGWDLVTGEGFRGEKTTDTPEHFVAWALKESAPFAMEEVPAAIGQIAEGDVLGGATVIGGEMFGAKSAPLSFRDQMNEWLKERGVPNYEEAEQYQKDAARRSLRMEAIGRQDSYFDDLDDIEYGDPANPDPEWAGRVPIEQQILEDLKARRIMPQDGASAYMDAQDEVRIRKAQAARSRGYAFEEPAPDDPDPSKRALAEWYAVFDDPEVSPLAGYVRWEKFTEKRLLLERRFKREGTWAYIVRNTSYEPHSEELMEKLKGVNWFYKGEYQNWKDGLKARDIFASDASTSLTPPIQTELQRAQETIAPQLQGVGRRPYKAAP